MRIPSWLLIAASTLSACDGRLDVLEVAPDDESGGGTSGSSSGGSSGTAGTGAGGSLPPSPFVLDDFEDGNSESLNIEDGYWYFEPDPVCTGSFVIELTPDRAGNTHAGRTRGGGCSAWGALSGLDLGGSAVGDVFDASSYDTLRVSARAEPGSVTTLSVSLLSPQHYDTVIEIGPEWRTFELPLDGFVFNDGFPQQPYNRARLTHLQFFVFSSESFDYWLDDIAFVRSE